MALTLRLMCRLTTRAIARAYLTAESTVAQRIVRAKRTLSAAHVPFVVPGSGRTARAAGLGTRGRLSDLQRGLRGEPVLLLDQDRSRWDWLLVGRGLRGLERAYATRGPIGPYTLQASVAACHARVRRPQDTDWERIVALYDGLAQLMPSPVVELNRVALLTANSRQRTALLDRAAACVPPRRRQ